MIDLEKIWKYMRPFTMFIIIGFICTWVLMILRITRFSSLVLRPNKTLLQVRLTSPGDMWLLWSFARQPAYFWSSRSSSCKCDQLLFQQQLGRRLPSQQIPRIFDDCFRDLRRQLGRSDKAAMIACYYPSGSIVMHKSFFMSMVYFYCRKYPHTSFSIWWVIKIKAYFFPIIYFLIELAPGFYIKDLLVGLIVGHLVYTVQNRFSGSRNSKCCSMPKCM